MVVSTDFWGLCERITRTTAVRCFFSQPKMSVRQSQIEPQIQLHQSSSFHGFFGAQLGVPRVPIPRESYRARRLR